MSVQADRRTFLGGLGAAIVMAACPVSGGGHEIGELPSHLHVALNPYPFTMANFADNLRKIFRAVQELGPLPESHRMALIPVIEEVLDQIRPAGVWIKLDMTLEKMRSLEFTITEPEPGIVLVQ